MQPTWAFFGKKKRPARYRAKSYLGGRGCYHITWIPGNIASQLQCISASAASQARVQYHVTDERYFSAAMQ